MQDCPECAKHTSGECFDCQQMIVEADENTVYTVVCEVVPGVLAAGIEDFSYAKKVAEVKAEEIWNEYGVSLYCVVKDTSGYGYHAVRYTPSDGGTFHVPIEYYMSVGA